jgi:hypothetical protein
MEPENTRLSFSFERRRKRISSLPPYSWKRSTGLWSTPKEADTAATEWLIAFAPPGSVIETRVVEVWTPATS